MRTSRKLQLVIVLGRKVPIMPIALNHQSAINMSCADRIFKRLVLPRLASSEVLSCLAFNLAASEADSLKNSSGYCNGSLLNLHYQFIKNITRQMLFDDLTSNAYFVQLIENNLPLGVGGTVGAPRV